MENRKKMAMSLPELAMLNSTRVMIGAGLGVFLADRLSADQRKAVGWALFLAGAAMSIPIGIEIVSRSLEVAEKSAIKAA
jgi:hypothetical protein